MKILSEEKYIRLVEQPLKVPIYLQVSSDLVSPIRAYFALKNDHRKGFLLESREHVQDVGRYSFVGFDPNLTVKVKEGKTTIQKGEKKQQVSAPFEEVIREILEENKILPDSNLPLLAGGAVGFMSYDAVRLFEKIPDSQKDEDKLPDIYFGFYETILAFDHLHQTLTLIYIPEKKGDPKEQYAKGREHLKNTLSKVLNYSPKVNINLDVLETSKKSVDFETDCSDEEYQEIVKRCKQLIKAGDIFQVVPSRTFYKKTDADPLSVFRILRIVNPSPFMFFLDNGDYVLTGSSPERFASFKEGRVETMPIAGTISRGVGAQDLINEKKLLADKKEVAEHMMLVDLARNDTGSLAEPASVEVHDMLSIQRLSHVMHITSRVTGKLDPKYDALDVLKAFLPAGTLSGAPKIRAMEIIDDLEKSRRGIYGGAICYIDNLGRLDSCIAIRMAEIRNGVAKVRAGAGIVYDSCPEKETLETLNKAQVVLQAIEKAERGGLC
ncbi:MAG: Anthranilate synthase component 1 [Chlamydiae bacterium]|nr:Anthranilate synthase component 1 [Chlamydiota bacterium]